jgi:hypothetical protein
MQSENGILLLCYIFLSHGNEEKAVQQVKDKYLGFVENCEILLFLGTTKQFHGWASNPLLERLLSLGYIQS